MKNIRARLILMTFIEFAVWGAYLISMGNYLAKVGLADIIWLFYAVPGFVAIVTPTFVGMISDKYIPAQKMLSICHLITGISLMALFMYCLNAPVVKFGVLFTLFTVNAAAYAPTLALTNSISCYCIEKAGYETVSLFPKIRVFGTIGFIASMLLTNFLTIGGEQFQNTCWQFALSGAFALLLAGYSLTLPAIPVEGKDSGDSQSLLDRLGFSAFSLFKDKDFAIFFLFAMLLGASLQITNGYANMYLSSFKDLPGYEHCWGANNANALISISQMSEALCILLIPFFLKRYGIKTVIALSMTAWVLRFGCFAIGNPGDRIWLIIISCIVYGLAFDFFNVASSIHINDKAPASMRSQAQGLFFLVTNGVGSSLGLIMAGQVVNHFVNKPMACGLAPEWAKAWFFFAAYALIVLVLFLIFFKNPQKTAAVNKAA